jgi:hypothetical protein
MTRLLWAIITAPFSGPGRGVDFRRAKAPQRGSREATAVARLRGRATIRLSTDEIMALTRQR